MNARVARRKRPGQSRAARHRRCGSFRRALRAEALLRAGLPRPATPVTSRIRCPSYRPGVALGREDQAVKHARTAPPPGKVTATGGGTPRIVRPLATQRA